MNDLLDDDFLPTKTGLKKRILWLNIFCLINILVSNLIIFAEVEYITIAGGIIIVSSIFGLVLSKGGLLSRAIHVLYLTSVVAVFLVIYLWDLSPNQAQKPIPFLVLIFSMAQIILNVIFFSSWNKVKEKLK